MFLKFLQYNQFENYLVYLHLLCIHMSIYIYACLLNNVMDPKEKVLEFCCFLLKLWILFDSISSE